MKISHVRLWVDDLPAARDFYADTLGLEPLWDQEGTAVGFDLGTTLIVERVDAADDPEDRAMIHRFAGVSIAVEDIHAVCAALKAKGVKFTMEPERQEWGGVLAHFTDPSGNVPTLMEA